MRTQWRTAILIVVAMVATGFLVRGLWPWLPLPHLAAVTPLPPYALELSDEIDAPFPRVNRLRTRSSAALALTLRPADPVRGEVVARAFLRDGNAWIPWAIHMEQSDAGAFHLRSPVSSLLGVRLGAQRLAFVLSRPWIDGPDVEAARRRGPSAEQILIEGELEILPDD